MDSEKKKKKILVFKVAMISWLIKEGIKWKLVANI